LAIHTLNSCLLNRLFKITYISMIIYMKNISLSFLVLTIVILNACKKNNSEAPIPRKVYPVTAAVAGQWRQMLDTFNIEIIDALSFSIGDNGYTINQRTNAIYSYSAKSNMVVRKKNFPGERRQSDATVFVIGNKAYYGLGVGQRSIKEGTQTEWQYQYFLDFWEYDPNSDEWTQKKPFHVPSATEVHSFLGAYGFGIGNKGFIGSGRDYHFAVLPYLFEYNPASDTWIERTSDADVNNYGPKYASVTLAFSINGKGYVGDSTHLWEYTPGTNTWKDLKETPGAIKQPVIALGGKTKGYIYGSLNSLNSFDPVLKNEFYEYVPSSNKWNKLKDFGGSARASCSGFILNDKVFIGFGSDLNASVLGDVWEYTP